MCVCACVCIYIKLLTIVEANLKAFFSITTTWRCREDHFSFFWIAPLYP